MTAAEAKERTRVALGKWEAKNVPTWSARGRSLTNGRHELETLTLRIPVRTPNPLNHSHGHWSNVARIRKKQRQAVSWAVLVVKTQWRAVQGLGAWDVRLTRFSIGKMDEDNLMAALKGVRDGVAYELGLADDSNPLVRWEYGQGPAKRGEHFVEVRVSRMAE